jgi:hypothetical protein
MKHGLSDNPLAKGLPFVLLALALTGCMPLMKTRSATTAGNLPPHEVWCYNTLGEADCYADPQNVPPNRLVNVDPPSRHPLTPQEHARAVAERR